VAAVSTFLAGAGANIIASDQYSTDPEGGRFFLRMEFHLRDLAGRWSALQAGLTDLASRRGLDWDLTPASHRKRVALFVSRYDHCLLDLLWRWRRGELVMDIVTVVSNHPDLQEDVAAFGIPYVHIPVTRDTKTQAEQQQIELLAGHVELVVMARYMQILSADFLQRIGAPVINIHHSFLPAFAGASPYARAHARGVKLIGATAHYATEDLDEGPIIEQDVVRVSHRDDAAALERIGADVERTVLARAVARHLADRVIAYENRTVVF
jgi:formyltetrahydrofolate deformylase